MALPIPALVVPEAAPDLPEAPVHAVPSEVTTRSPITYRELLADESNSPAPARLANYLQGYRCERGGGIPTTAVLRDQTVTLSDRQPLPFLCLVQGPSGTPEVGIIHRLMRYIDMPGEEESGFHDKVLGLLGDILCRTSTRRWKCRARLSIW